MAILRDFRHDKKGEYLLNQGFILNTEVFRPFFWAYFQASIPLIEIKLLEMI